MGNPLAGARFRWSSTPGPITIEDYRRRARRKLPDMVWAYLDGESDDLVTLQANRDAFAQWSFRPRVLTGQEGTGLSAPLGSSSLRLPVYLSPTGMTGLAHWSGEVAAARAAERQGTRAVISTAASYTPEEIAAATSEDHFFQLYPWANPETGARALSSSFIRRAHDCGYQGLFVTVDVPVHGNREGERRRGLGVPPVLSPARILNASRKRAWTYNVFRHQRIAARLLLDSTDPTDAVRSAREQLRLMRPELDWDDLAWMRQEWSDRPLYVKGVLHPDDAERAVAVGADGIVVSNHGGRQLDGCQSSLDALPAIVDRVGGHVPVLLDGGVRRGTDVVKALCLGATAVGIGRPYLYGLAANGQAGVEHVLEILREEISRALTLLGCASVDRLGREHLVRVGLGDPVADGQDAVRSPARRSDNVT